MSIVGRESFLDHIHILVSSWHSSWDKLAILNYWSLRSNGHGWASREQRLFHRFFLCLDNLIRELGFRSIGKNVFSLFRMIMVMVVMMDLLSILISLILNNCLFTSQNLLFLKYVKFGIHQVLVSDWLSSTQCSVSHYF